MQRIVVSAVLMPSRTNAIVITKIQDIEDLVARGRIEPSSVFPQIRVLAASSEWQTREVAATALVEIAKRQPVAVINQAALWASDRDGNIRRAASEGLRGLVKSDPDAVRPIIAMLRADPELYVRKSVANVLRNASGKHPEFVLEVGRQWSRSSSPHTHWIVKEGLRKLMASRPDEVNAVLESHRVGTSAVKRHSLMKRLPRELP